MTSCTPFTSLQLCCMKILTELACGWTVRTGLRFAVYFRMKFKNKPLRFCKLWTIHTVGSICNVATGSQIKYGNINDKRQVKYYLEKCKFHVLAGKVTWHKKTYLAVCHSYCFKKYLAEHGVPSVNCSDIPAWLLFAYHEWRASQVMRRFPLFQDIQQTVGGCPGGVE